MPGVRISAGSVQGYTDNVGHSIRLYHVSKVEAAGKALRYKFESSLYFPTCSARLAASDPIKAHAIRYFNIIFLSLLATVHYSVCEVSFVIIF